jgi:predicted metal-dependent hydrolase
VKEEKDHRFLEFIQLFNSEKFFEAHEVLEELWLETTGARKQFYQGLIQCAVALAHWQRKNSRGAVQVGNRALTTLKMYDPKEEGIDVARLIQECESFLNEQILTFPQIKSKVESGQ